MYEYHATVVKVVDGDTLHLDVDLGLDVHTKIIVRLYGLNTPEMPTPEGKAAKDFVTQWVEQVKQPNGQVIIYTIKDRREKYGRYLAVIRDLTLTRHLNSELLDGGYAVAYLP